MDNYFKVPFANAGDKTTIPDDTQANGSVSYTTGYGLDYQKQRGVDADAKAIERDKMNSLLFKTTAAIQAMQTFGGASAFITAADNGGTAYSYSKGARVSLSGVVYESLTNSNTTTPPGANWQIVNWSDVVAFMDTRFVNATGDFNLTGDYRTTGQLAANVIRSANAGFEIFNGQPGEVGTFRRWKTINIPALSDALRIEGDYAQKGLTLSQTGDLDAQGYVHAATTLHAGTSISTPGTVQAGADITTSASISASSAVISSIASFCDVRVRNNAGGVRFRSTGSIAVISNDAGTANAFLQAATPIASENSEVVATTAWVNGKVGNSDAGFYAMNHRVIRGSVLIGDAPSGISERWVSFPSPFVTNDVTVILGSSGTDASNTITWVKEVNSGGFNLTIQELSPYVQSMSVQYIAMGFR